ncbi:MAG TPA: RidA family protein [Candidatus Limnocylindrales bacterium]|nr:RidA family protein [Candidatus Limnocylindrales bacterium]
MAPARTIDPPGLFRSPRYANIIVAGDFAFIAGQTAFDEQGNVVGVGDIKAQCEKTFENMSIALRAVNAEPKDIVKVTILVTDRAFLATLVEVRNRMWGEMRTASTAVVSGLARDTLLVEVDAVVYLGKDTG